MDDVSLELTAGSFTALMGRSGSGKSTLLQVASGLDRPQAGSVRLGELELTALSEAALTRLRRRHVGFVFQSYNLMPALTVRQNVLLPARLDRARLDDGWVADVLARAGLGELLGRRPAQLSGGQQQRVALARALVGQPRVVFADEPTGALDTQTGHDVLALLRGCVDDLGQTVLMVTHDPAAAAYADRVLFMRDGRLADQIHKPSVGAIATAMNHLSAS